MYFIAPLLTNKSEDRWYKSISNRSGQSQRNHQSVQETDCTLPLETEKKEEINLVRRQKEIYQVNRSQVNCWIHFHRVTLAPKKVHNSYCNINHRFTRSIKVLQQHRSEEKCPPVTLGWHFLVSNKGSDYGSVEFVIQLQIHLPIRRISSLGTDNTDSMSCLHSK